MTKYDPVESQSTAYSLLRDSREQAVVGVVYRGVVKDNMDPSNVGRVKVYVPSLYPNIPIEKLPWALPCFSAASYQSGSFIVPEVESNVWVLFENNDIFKPVWIGAFFSINVPMNIQTGNNIALANESYVPVEAVNPNHYVVMKSPKGSAIYIDDENEMASVSSTGGGSIELGEASRMMYAGGGNLSVEKDGVIGQTQENGELLIRDHDEDNDGNNVAILRRGEYNQIKIVEGLHTKVQGAEESWTDIDDERTLIYTNEREITVSGEYIEEKFSDSKRTIIDTDGIKLLHEGCEIGLSGEGLASGEASISMESHGNIIFHSDNYTEIKCRGDRRILLDRNGIYVGCNGGGVMISDSGITLSIDGDINISASGSINLEGSSINIPGYKKE